MPYLSVGDWVWTCHCSLTAFWLDNEWQYYCKFQLTLSRSVSRLMEEVLSRHLLWSSSFNKALRKLTCTYLLLPWLYMESVYGKEYKDECLLLHCCGLCFSTYPFLMFPVSTVSHTLPSTVPLPIAIACTYIFCWCAELAEQTVIRWSAWYHSWFALLQLGRLHLTSPLVPKFLLCNNQAKHWTVS